MASGDSLHLSELRIVLLGGRDEGKSSSGNTILGREEFDLRTTAQCVKRQGEVAGRQVTVVDTPGWWRIYPVESTTELVKQEIVHSVSLCPPGPHTLLLVIKLDVSFTEEDRRSVEGHLQLLSERVWSHTIVLFTHGDCLGDTTIEQHIETEGKALQWLVEKCGNRYHVLNNENRGDDSQVTELLDKTEEMVAANSGDVFYPDIDISKEMNWSSEEYQTSPLPLKRAKSIEGVPPNKWGGGRSDVLSLGSSGYASQTSRPSDHSSGIKPQKSPHTRLNPEPAHSREPPGPIPTSVMPEFTSQTSETSYRLQCPHAGVFQCRLTGLAFQMEGEGEVLYRTVQWDEGLLVSTGQTPAGPLFNISCPQGSVCQLHLPHCEILSGGGLKSLSVAHVSGGNVELPLWGSGETVDTLPHHQGEGAVLPPTTRPQALYSQPGCYTTQRSTPRGSPSNTPKTHRYFNRYGCTTSPEKCELKGVKVEYIVLFQVGRMQRAGSYIDVCSDCTLSRGEVYSVCCDVVEGDMIQPKHVQVYWNYGPNYHPTFQVFLNPNTEEVGLRLLEKAGKGEAVWTARVPLTGSSSLGGRQTEHAQKGCAEEQLRSARLTFVERVSMPVLDNLLDGLLQERVINDCEREAAIAETQRVERARATIDMVLRKGDESWSVMRRLLCDMDPYLHSTLGFK
ncbi:uncharacterized protein LOC134035336 [Osmerus eperlanus]|uniref:uncharacterized protein LOC134035336 n=1 Tax=Osmerus eperlanus TaxID=29151 RepID=UPI002E11A8BF